MMGKFAAANAASAGASAGGVSAGSALGGMSMFTNFPEREMGNFVVISLTIITISNIVAARIVGGGDRYMFYFYTALFCVLTGLILLIAPIGVNIFFSPEGLSNMGKTGAGAVGMYLI
jgi:flagellar protein FlaJ